MFTWNRRAVHFQILFALVSSISMSLAQTRNQTVTADVVALELTYWWPAHRPMEVVTYQDGQYDPQGRWSPTSQNHTGDLQMVTQWAQLGFVLKNPDASAGSQLPAFVNVPSGDANVWGTKKGETK